MPVKALTFDTYGTVVDWRSSVLAELTAFGASRGLSIDWERFLDEWKACYRPGMDAVNRGESPWITVETIYAHGLDALVRSHALKLSDSDREHLIHSWWRLVPWPDVPAGLRRLRERYILSPLSNASFAGMVHLAKFAGLPWDCIITAENAKLYKPRPEVYRTAIELLGMAAGDVMMVAAHNYDLRAARELGMRTAFVSRPLEYGPGQKTDLVAEDAWDVVAKDFEELATALGT